ncbi:MAG: GNAT family N-acetyltransferase [Deltaproteobacteria bacterium]|nr:GNAT family N-acetyltransferase [Deltaproteobacteria bacterium]
MPSERRAPPEAAVAAATVRPVTRDDAPALLAINRACPIEANFTFYFDRAPDFFAWPDAVFDQHEYLGVYSDDRLVGYGLCGTLEGWIGDGWGPYVYGGDLRVLPGWRGAGLAKRIILEFIDRLPPGRRAAFMLVKDGNVAATGLISPRRWAVPRFVHRVLCRFEAANLLLLRRTGGPRRCRVRHAREGDVEAMAALMTRALQGRLFAPQLTAERLARDAERVPGLGLDRYFLAERDGRLVGVLAAWDEGPLRRTTLLGYDLGGKALRAGYRAASLVLRNAAPLPEVGESFRSLTATRVAIADRDPGVLEDLLRAVVDEHLGHGYHMLHVGFAGEDPLRVALKPFFAQSFRSQIYLVAEKGAYPSVWPPGHEDPYVDLAII